MQVRPQARALDDAERERAAALFDDVAEGNAVVVHRELVREDGAHAPQNAPWDHDSLRMFSDYGVTFHQFYPASRYYDAPGTW